MIELVILDYLNENLQAPVYLERPEQKEDTYVLLEKTGSSRENRIDTATFAVQSVAPTLLLAAELNEEVKTNMFGLATLDEVAAVRLNSDYNFTNTETKEYRYQAVFHVVHY